MTNLETLCDIDPPIRLCRWPAARKARADLLWRKRHSPIDHDLLEREYGRFAPDETAGCSATPAGAKASAVVCSLVLTGRAIGLAPFVWLRHVLAGLPQRPTEAGIRPPTLHRRKGSSRSLSQWQHFGRACRFLTAS